MELTDAGGTSRVQAFKDFMASDAEALVCTHATLRFAFDQLGASHFLTASLPLMSFIMFGR